MNLLQVIMRGSWMLIPIVVCSLIAIAIIIERFLALRKARVNTRHLMLKLRNLLLKGDIKEAVGICSATPGPVAKILFKGISKHHKSREEIKETIESGGKEELYFLERNLGVLATIAGVAPLLGFLGTVTGMIKAFMEIQRLGGNVNATVLAGGIWEALITTAAGLVVGIITYIFYNYLVSRVQKLVFEMESSSNELLELLDEENSNEHKKRSQITEHF